MNYIKRTLVGISLLSIGLLALTWNSMAQNVCPDSNPSRLLVGSLGRVIPVGDPNNVRKEPAKSGKKLGQIDSGKTFTVLEGPVCADDVTWVRVKDDNGIVGWTAELIGADYALEPALPALVPTAVMAAGAVDFNGVHLDVDPALAALVEAKIDLGQPSGSQVFPGGLVFNILGPNSDLAGTVKIVPAQSFNNRYLTSIWGLGNVLSGTPEATIPNSMSWFINNGTLINATEQKALTLNSAKGYRRLALYGQTPDAADSRLTYEAHALTDDGLYYIQASFFVAASDTASLTGPFSPDPAALDALLASITIAPNTLSDALTESDTIATAYAPTQAAIFTQQFMPTPTLTPTLSPNDLAMTATAEVQCGPFPSTLHVGDMARQSLRDGTLRVRQSPNGEAIPDTRLFFEDVVRVEEGPVCVEETNWWRVTAADGRWTGWVAEAGLEDVYLVWISPTPLPPTDIPAGPTSVPTQAYDCTYTPATGEHALLNPQVEGRWEYFLIAGHTYHAIYQFTNTNGETWYVLAYESPINKREDGTGSTIARGSWVMGATGSECGSLPTARYDSLIVGEGL